ncbi:hypothetical protein OOT46_08055 [Aquabacterium sp. A7-Y]|uniref:DUF2946 family protein n=1 Tax=Aquabacterium sp. A7-Y TaxID=1349605 RepID=UPI00223D05E0|nr:DUF2946 family protein [Aquabacterium sp. A7-Y]MCW7537802.1 hypothetical protein [Aquabacterium sp. A7-Y]
MSASRRSPRLAFWVIAFALLLKAGTPLLAAAAASWQGRTLVEVCTAYGVKTVMLAADGSELGAPNDTDPDRSGSSTLHGDAHCVLSGLLAFAAPGGPEAAAGPHAPRLPPRATAPPEAFAPDAAADWTARLQHAPPISG